MSERICRHGSLARKCETCGEIEEAWDAGRESGLLDYHEPRVGGRFEDHHDRKEREHAEADARKDQP